MAFGVPEMVVIGIGFGIPELVVILIIFLLLFGASRLPELGKGIGKGIKNFKEATRDGISEKND